MSGPEDDVEWGVCSECGDVTAWMGKNIACEQCPHGVYVPADDDGLRP